MKYWFNEDESIRLYNGDCLGVMSKLIENGIRVDAVITDPPYNIARDNNLHTMKGKNGKLVHRRGIDFGEWDKGFDQISWLEYLPKILNKNGSVIIFNDWKKLGDTVKKLEEINFEIKDMIRWEKSNPMPRNRDRRYIVDYECAVWAVMPNSKWVFNRQDEKFQRPKFVYPSVSGKEKTIHPTQKNVALMRDLVKIHSNENDVILDCFMGSGTTGVACKELKRSFIGIELDEPYFNIAVERIKNI